MFLRLGLRRGAFVSRCHGKNVVDSRILRVAEVLVGMKEELKVVGGGLHCLR